MHFEGASTRRLTSIRPLCRGLIGPSELPSNLSSDVFVYLSHERVGVTAPSEFYVGNDRAFQLEDNEESNKVLIMRFGNACCASRIPLSDFRMKGQLPPIVGS